MTSISATRSGVADGRFGSPRRHNSDSTATAEEIVAAKLTQFAKIRFGTVHSLAERLKVEVPTEVDEFFAAAAAGHWEELSERFEALRKRRQTSDNGGGLENLWGPILETFGVAEQAHDWPAQKLLDYGNGILDSLRPGMVYVGGTDPGRFIPTLLNETSEGEHHMVVTQNALADGSYLQYLNFLHGDNMATLTSDESQRAFQDYIADAQKRLAHDQEFPDEPKQIRPGENVQMVDNRIQVSGQTAVMSINEMLLKAMMDKNPELSFAIEESFPLWSTYSNAAPLGPIMELRVQDEQNTLTADRAAQTMDYWRATTQQVLADVDPGTDAGANVLKTYSKMAVAEANLMASHNFDIEAEQAYRLGTQIWRDSPEAAYGLAGLLVRTHRASEATQILKDFEQRNSSQPDFALWKAILSGGSPASLDYLDCDNGAFRLTPPHSCLACGG